MTSEFPHKGLEIPKQFSFDVVIMSSTYFPPVTVMLCTLVRYKRWCSIRGHTYFRSTQYNLKVQNIRIAYAYNYFTPSLHQHADMTLLTDHMRFITPFPYRKMYLETLYVKENNAQLVFVNINITATWPSITPMALKTQPLLQCFQQPIWANKMKHQNSDLLAPVRRTNGFLL